MFIFSLKFIQMADCCEQMIHCLLNTSQNIRAVYNRSVLWWNLFMSQSLQYCDINRFQLRSNKWLKTGAYILLKFSRSINFHKINNTARICKIIKKYVQFFFNFLHLLSYSRKHIISFSLQRKTEYS